MTADDLPWKGRSVLVTGATGMVGSWLCLRLVEAGARVTALVRDPDPQSELYRAGTIRLITVVSGRLESFGDVERAVNENAVDTVFHLGAQTIVGVANRSPLPTIEANVLGTANVLEACRVHRSLVRAVVVASSDKAYGEHDDLPYLETMALQGRHPYDVSKSCVDLLSQAYHATYGLPVGIARAGNIFGGGDLNWSRIVPGTLRSLALGEQPVLRSDGTFLRDYVFVDDVVDGYLALALALDGDDVRGEAFNLSVGSPLTVLEIYDAVCTAAGRPGVVPCILNAADGEIHDQYLDAAKARTVLGWEPRHGLEEGLRQTAAWYERFFRSGS